MSTDKADNAATDEDEAIELGRAWKESPLKMYKALTVIFGTMCKTHRHDDRWEFSRQCESVAVAVTIGNTGDGQFPAELFVDLSAGTKEWAQSLDLFHVHLKILRGLLIVSGDKPGSLPSKATRESKGKRRERNTVDEDAELLDVLFKAGYSTRERQMIKLDRCGVEIGNGRWSEAKARLATLEIPP